jgi:hypothetical protein
MHKRYPSTNRSGLAIAQLIVPGCKPTQVAAGTLKALRDTVALRPGGAI